MLTQKFKGIYNKYMNSINITLRAEHISEQDFCEMRYLKTNFRLSRDN